jgi:hypothetical protein
MARLDVRFEVDTAVTSKSTRLVEASNTLIINEPSGFTVQVQERGRKPHSMIWRSSSMEIMTGHPYDQMSISLAHKAGPSTNTLKQIKTYYPFFSTLRLCINSNDGGNSVWSHFYRACCAHGLCHVGQCSELAAGLR